MFNSAALTPAERRRELAHKAHQCARWLRINGFEVIAIAGGVRMPRVIIQQHPLCNTLDGVAQAYERTRMGEARYHFVLRFDCMVQWPAVAESLEIPRRNFFQRLCFFLRRPI